MVQMTLSQISEDLDFFLFAIMCELLFWAPVVHCAAENTRDTEE